MNLIPHPKFVDGTIAALQRLDSEIHVQVVELVEQLLQLEALPDFRCFGGLADSISSMWEEIRPVMSTNDRGRSLRAELMMQMNQAAATVKHHYVSLYSAKELAIYIDKMPAH